MPEDRVIGRVEAVISPLSHRRTLPDPPTFSQSALAAGTSERRGSFGPSARPQPHT